LGNRIASWFRRNTSVAGHYAVGNWSSQPKILITISVERAFEAPSLEEFLIEQLNPSDNIAVPCPTHQLLSGLAAYRYRLIEIIVRGLANEKQVIFIPA
jgi:hypothetical protein